MLAARIKERMDELGLSAADLADACGISVQAVYQWLSGKNKNLKHEHFFALCDALNVNPRWLALGEGAKVAAQNREAYRVALSRREETDDPKAKEGWERVAIVFAKAATVVLFLAALVRPELAQAATIGRFDITEIPQKIFAKALNVIHIVSVWFRTLFCRNVSFQTATL